MQDIEDIVIVGAGIAGLATALGLHRLGLKSLVLESSDSLRVTGYAFSTWANAWRALDALRIGELLRHKHLQLEGIKVFSLANGLPTSHLTFSASNQSGSNELRCMKRRLLLETLVQELPEGTVRFGSKVASIDQSKNLTLVHLADGSILKTKVLIGCDGVNSVVSRWLGLSKPNYVGRSAIRGFSEFPGGHGFKSEFYQYNGNGYRCGFLPCDDKFVYWFFTYFPSRDLEEDKLTPLKMKQFVLSNIGMVPRDIKDVVENTGLDSVVSSPLRFRKPWELLWGNICKGGVTVAGDALHPMTPDLGQGACSALEDGVVLARCIGAVFSVKSNVEEEEEEGERVRKAIEKYAKERRWRSFELVTAGLLVGWTQQIGGSLMNFVRDKWLSTFLAQCFVKKAGFDVGKL